MHFTNALLVLTALSAGSASARSVHRAHSQLHDQKRAVGDLVTTVIDGKTVSWTNTFDGGAAKPESNGVSPPAVAAAVAPAAAAVKGVISNVLKAKKPFCEGKLQGRATAAEIAYSGNTYVGAYGCNMQLIDNSIAAEYEYTMKFTNKGAETQEVICAPKNGPTGDIAGGSFSKGVIKFNIAPGEVKTCAFAADTQGFCAASPGTIPRTSNGQLAGIWAEFDYANESNEGWAGGDVSALVAMSQNLPVPAMKLCARNQCSAIGEGATNIHSAYVTGLEAVDGLGANLTPGKAEIDVILG